MNPEPQTHGSQPYIEIDWPSDTDLSFLHEAYDLDSYLEAAPQSNDDLSAILSLDTCNSDSCAKTLQQSNEKPCSETQFTAEETQTRLFGATQPTTGASPPIVDTKASTPHPIHSTPELAVRETPVCNTRGGEGQPKPERASMQEIEVCLGRKLRLGNQILAANKAQLRFLRYKLQTGLLPTVGQPKADEMKVMSAYLRKLEHIGDPPRSILRATRTTKLLKKITNLDEIPRDSKFSFKERAVVLLEKWRTNVEKEDPTTSSGQPIKNDGIGLNAIADEQKPANTVDSQQPLDSGTQTSATGLIEECKSEQSTSDHNNKSAVAPANEHYQPTPPPSPALQDTSKSTLERMVIDLTDDDEIGMGTGSELPHQPTDQKSLGPSVAKSTQATRSPPPSSTSECFLLLSMNDLTYSYRF
jgi:hypothetical protein